MWRPKTRALGLFVILVVTPVCAQPISTSEVLEALVAAYPDTIARHDGEMLYWRDGTAMRAADNITDTGGRPLREPSIVDQFRQRYPRGPLASPPPLDFDPGRLRNISFFKKMYGNCDKGEVSPRLVPIRWLPKTWDKTIRITSINHVDQRLRSVSMEIDALPDKIKHAAYPPAGTYNCRIVADTGQVSPHAFGIAIDLNLAISDYWYWGSHGKVGMYKNRIPEEIVDIFEKHGFIWGGKWYHFDTMHFEYRPELLGIAAH